MSNWKTKYKSIKDYYKTEFGGTYYKLDGEGIPIKELGKSPFYTLTPEELAINPDETIEELNELGKDPEFAEAEIRKCINSFPYFAARYLRIAHPTAGLIRFVLFDYQRDIIKAYESNKRVILGKFRQAGISTVTLLWSLWKCLFRNDEAIMCVSMTDREAVKVGYIVSRAMDYLPNFLKCKMGKCNDHLKEFQETNSWLAFHSVDAARGVSLSSLIIDEASRVPDMYENWAALLPTLSTGGSCQVISTPAGYGNWYQETYYEARRKKGSFVLVEIEYYMHPLYNNPKWIKEMREELGTRKWAQEVLHSFLDSGATYFNSLIIHDTLEKTKNNIPRRIKCLEYANEKEDFFQDLEEKGALWVWEERIDGHEYIIGVDCAEGAGEGGDNCCFQIIDQTTLIQAAEFYSNTVRPHIFAKILYEIGIYYNNALIVIENASPAGGAAINHLRFKLPYDNLHYDSSSKRQKDPKAGISNNHATRGLFLDSLSARLEDGTLKINSPRVPTEMNTFCFNGAKGRAEAQNGKHDDAIMALAIALYVRDTTLYHLPVGAQNYEETDDAYTKKLMEKIKNDIREGGVINYLAEEDEDILKLPNEYDDENVPVRFIKRNKIFKEFGF